MTEKTMNIRLLRGQVVIREDLNADTSHYRHIVVPGVSDAERHDPDARARARTWHRGTVLAIGAPMLTSKGVEVPHGFAVGDDVIFHWEHREKSWTREWVDGKRAAWLPQWCVDAVVNERLFVIGDFGGGGGICSMCGLEVAGHLLPVLRNSAAICPTEVAR